MSYNHFYTNYCGRNVTFHDFPPYPPPTLPHIAPMHPTISDQEFLKRYETGIPIQKARINLSAVKISQIKEELSTLISSHNDIQEQENKLVQGISSLSEEDWQAEFNRIAINKNVINSIIRNLHGSQLDLGKKLIAKRISKRVRLKKIKEEVKLQKKERIKKLQEKSRKIDENLQKIQNDILRSKQAAEDKMQADIVLREVLRKKHDAKKNIVKLEALVKLRKSRLNTAKGMGKTVAETETTAFMDNIDKIKILWEHKLSIYQSEEQDLRNKLAHSSPQDSSVTNKEVLDNLIKWKEAMFGDNVNPQVDFNGDIEQFISVRKSWDCYLESGPDSTPIPIGWLTPTLNT